MSRSYKKSPVFKDKNKGMKNAANRKVRRRKGEISDGMDYKKVFPSYDISDYLFREPKETIKDSDLNWWRKYYYNK